jgi:hypothetical protein
MIRLTVLYNLKPFVDEEEFLKWRLGAHQQSNAAMPGVLRTDFARIEGVWPDGAPVPYRFMTTADWPDMASFRAAFYEPQALAALEKNLEMLSDPIFLVSEILVNQTVEAPVQKTTQATEEAKPS